MIFQTLRERFVSHLIADYVPLLNLVRRPHRWPTLETLRAYPRGTLGEAVATYLDARALPFKVRYENHDAIHAILDYETNIQGEMEVQAFLWANRASSHAGRILFVVGGLLLPEHHRAMKAAYRRGLQARAIRESDLPHRLNESFNDVRMQLEPQVA
jgi:ubiquinone biosynthesis protein Coq4